MLNVKCFTFPSERFGLGKYLGFGLIHHLQFNIHNPDSYRDANQKLTVIN